MPVKLKISQTKIIQMAQKSTYGSQQYSICTPKTRFLLKEIQPPHFCNWRHFLCFWSTWPTIISAAEHIAVCEWETARHNTAPVSPAQPAARPLSITKSTGTNLQGTWKAKHPAHTPGQSPVQAIYPGSGLRRRDVVLPLGLCCWQGQACLTQTPWTTAALKVCDWFWLPEAKGEASLSFKEEILHNFLSKCTSALLFMCTNLTAYSIWIKKEPDPVGNS